LFSNTLTKSGFATPFIVEEGVGRGDGEMGTIFALLPSSFFLLPSSFFLLPSSFFLLLNV